MNKDYDEIREFIGICISCNDCKYAGIFDCEYKGEGCYRKNLLKETIEKANKYDELEKENLALCHLLKEEKEKQTEVQIAKKLLELIVTRQKNEKLKKALKIYQDKVKLTHYYENEEDYENEENEKPALELDYLQSITNSNDEERQFVPISEEQLNLLKELEENE